MPYITIESGVLTDAQKEQLIKRLTQTVDKVHDKCRGFFSY